MVCGGFPCVGYSPLGLSKGFEQPGTKLFYEMLRVVDECKAEIVFLENVPNIVAHGMTEIAYQLHELRGFDLRWIVLPASSVGAHHKRNRWFALATKPGLKKDWSGLQYQNHNFDPKDSPPRMVLRGDPAWATRSTRCALLGNSVVPDVVRKAFFILASGFRDADQTAATLRLQEPDASRLRVLDETARAFAWPAWGTVDAYRVCSAEPIRFANPDLRLVLFQDLKKVIPSSRVTTEIISVYKLRSWSTPRFGNTGSSNTLTVRSARDLPSQLRFEERRRGGYISQVEERGGPSGSRSRRRGSVGCDFASFKALSVLFDEKDYRFVDVITRVFIINADDALRTAWYLASSVPPANQFAQLITLL
ncbi:hypothetical protein KFL_001810035 [Klebsormidium nitens]|uniref:DNA (cytosine-5-)-methyltransferase n=1 Tax=Klebsormidium nitens TaxID=105231 RepID=A0A1Y1I2N5_KLENI|nr:hypothetical protein KFL_001810035 [Klebsormidium nitens]|eukprot:GAQ84222.1 hypothetical protein KFL_001810035 [Klebsormidium nitens]